MKMSKRERTIYNLGWKAAETAFLKRLAAGKPMERLLSRRKRD